MRLEDAPDVLTVDELAEILRVSRWSVYERVRDGSLPALHLGRALRFSRAAVAALLAGDAGDRPTLDQG